MSQNNKINLPATRFIACGSIFNLEKYQRKKNHEPNTS
jgi:hypothetical protein